MPKFFWPEAVRWTTHVLNRSPTALVEGQTPEECWSGIKPCVDYFRVWGCTGDVHVSDIKRTKLDDKSYKCVLLGFSDESKAYRLFDPIAKKIVISRDVVFHEDDCWDWNRSKEEIQLDILDWGDDAYETDVHDFSHSDAEDDHAAEDEEHADDEDFAAVNDEDFAAEESAENLINASAEDTSSSSTRDGSNVRELGSSSGELTLLNPSRIRRAPSWMQDYESGENLTEDDSGDNMTEDSMQFLALFTQQGDPTCYEEAVRNENWKAAMDLEIDAIVKNKTWDFVNLPIGAKKIGVKWVYKTKLNENGAVDKYKAV